MRALILLVPVLLCHCGGWQKITYNDAGGVSSVVQTDGFGDEAEGTAKRITLPGGVEMTSISKKPNRTRVLGKVVDAVSTYGAAAILSRENVNDSNNSAKVEGQRIKSKERVDVKKLDNEALEITGKNDIGKIEASKP